MNRWLLIRSLTRLCYTLGIGFLLVGVVLSLVNQPVMAAATGQVRPTSGPADRPLLVPRDQPGNGGRVNNQPERPMINPEDQRDTLRDALQGSNRIIPAAPTVTGYDVTWYNQDGSTGDLALCELYETTVTSDVRVTMPEGVTATLKLDWYWANPPGVPGYTKGEHISYHTVSNGDTVSSPAEWPGAAGYDVVEIHWDAALYVGGNVYADDGMDYYWYPWVCTYVTSTPTSTVIFTPTSTSTATATVTPTETLVSTPTVTETLTATATETATATPTSTEPSDEDTPTPTSTEPSDEDTPTPTSTEPSDEDTPTPTSTQPSDEDTPTPTSTDPTGGNTPTPTRTSPPENTRTPTRTSPPGNTRTPTRTSPPGNTRTPTSTQVITVGGPTSTPTNTATITLTLPAGAPTGTPTGTPQLVGVTGGEGTPTPVPTLGAPASGTDGSATGGQQLIPVGGADMRTVAFSMNMLQSLSIQLGLVFLGIALALHGISSKLNG